MIEIVSAIAARHAEDEAAGPFAGRRSEQSRLDRGVLLAEIARLREERRSISTLLQKVESLEADRVVPVEEREPQKESLAFPTQSDFFDRVITDAKNRRRKMPFLFGKPATELSKKELLAFAIILSGPVDSYATKEQ